MVQNEWRESIYSVSISSGYLISLFHSSFSSKILCLTRGEPSGSPASKVFCCKEIFCYTQVGSVCLSPDIPQQYCLGCPPWLERPYSHHRRRGALSSEILAEGLTVPRGNISLFLRKRILSNICFSKYHNNWPRGLRILILYEEFDSQFALRDSSRPVFFCNWGLAQYSSAWPNTAMLG